MRNAGNSTPGKKMQKFLSLTITGAKVDKTDLLCALCKNDFIVFWGMRNIFIIYMCTDIKSLFQF